MASKQEIIIEAEDITCPGCNNLYDTTTEAPRLLSCLHVVCSTCLDQKTTQHGLACPVCDINILSQDVSALPQHIGMSNLVEAWTLKTMDDKTVYCSCSKDATNRCLNCQEFKCAQCTIAHKTGKMTKDHTVLAIESLRGRSLQEMTREIMCDQRGHEQFPLVLFCTKSSCMKPVCVRCIKESMHSCPTVTDLAEAYSEQVKRATELKSQTQATQLKRKDIISSIESEMQKFQSSFDDNCTDVDRIFDEYLKILEKCRNSRKMELKTAMERKSASLKQQSDEIASRVKDIENKRTRCEKLIQISPPAALCAMSNTIQTQLMNLNQLYSNDRMHENSVLRISRDQSDEIKLEDVLKSLVHIVSTEADVDNTKVMVRRILAEQHSCLATLLLRDKRGKTVFENTANIGVELSDSDGNTHPVDAPQYKSEDGSYEVFGTCPNAGQYTLHVSIDDRLLENREFCFDAVGSPTLELKSTDTVASNFGNSKEQGSMVSISNLEENSENTYEVRMNNFSKEMLHGFNSHWEETTQPLKARGQSSQSSAIAENSTSLISDVYGPPALMVSPSLSESGSKRTESIPVGMYEVLSNKELQDKINSQLGQRNIYVNWSVSEGTVHTVGGQGEDVRRCLDTIKSCVDQTAIKVRPEQAFLLGTDIWQSCKGGLTTRYQNKIFIDDKIESRGSIEVCSMTNITQDVLRQINAFLGDNSVSTIRLRYPVSISQRLLEVFDKDFTEIRKPLSQYFVRISHDKDSDTFVIRGIAIGSVYAALALQQKVQVLESTSQSEDRQRERDDNQDGGISDSRREPRRIKERCGFLLELLITEQSIRAPALYSVGGERLICVLHADMTSLAVDVIVNAADATLCHDGGLALAIVKKGGQSIQTECTVHVHANGRLEAGVIFCSKAGLLSCGHVIHAVSPKWKGGEQKERARLSIAVQRCLEKASEIGARSIAFPALGAGTFLYPVAKATRCIVETVHEFFNQNKGSPIREVYFCEYFNIPTIRCFQESCSNLVAEKDAIVCKI